VNLLDFSLIAVVLLADFCVSFFGLIETSLDVAHSGITPGITRRPERLLEFEIMRVGGRVHAVPMQSQGSSGGIERPQLAIVQAVFQG
jgi:hypothetical protein